MSGRELSIEACGDSQPATDAVDVSEAWLRARFEVREETFSHGDCRFECIMPRDAVELLDEEAFTRDERMPYWADLWPSARALARWVLDAPALRGACVELGCGLALPSLALKHRGCDVLATDHNGDGLAFARVNAQRNGLGTLRTRLLDWRTVDDAPRACDVALASDVLYEQRNVDALRSIVARMLGPSGMLVLADPGRRWLGQFCQSMRQSGWRERELATLLEPSGASGVTVRVIEFTRAA